MARVHKLLLTLASGSAFYSSLVPALGLGGISLHSALNQPLDAEIELLEIGDLNEGEIKISLASADAFAHAGVERFLFLNDLRFSPVIRGSNSHIRVVSSKPVREPYLNFIVEVARPNGKLLREYTLLLDPPGSAYTPSAAPFAPAQASPRSTATRVAVQPGPAPASSQGKRYRVERNDSLWLIAKRASVGSGMSLRQMLDGIHALNVQVFPDGNLDRLSIGQSLLLPDSANFSRAETMVANKQAASVDPEPAATITVANPSSSLEDLSQVQQRLDASLAQGEAERAQLRQRLVELQARLDAMQAQLTGKEQQIAELQGKVQQINAVPAEPVPSPVPMPAAQVAERATENPHGHERSVTSPFWWVVMSAGLVLLFVLDWVLLRRSRRDAQQQELEDAQSSMATVTLQNRRQEEREEEELLLPDIAEPVADSYPELDEDPLAMLPTMAPEIAPAQRQAVPSLIVPVQDPLDGANMYAAYGRWREALGVLRPAIAAEPERLDLRYRLLEVLGELYDPVSFTLEVAELRTLHADEERLATICERYANQSPDGAPDEPSFILNEPAPELVEARAELAEEWHPDFDGYPLDADWEQISPFKAAEPKRKANVIQVFPRAEDNVVFPTHLQTLPEVSELIADADAMSAFGELPDLPREETLDPFSMEFVDPMVSLDELDAGQESFAKLNLALAYIKQGNIEVACGILNEVISEGDDQQKQEARDLLASIA